MATTTKQKLADLWLANMIDSLPDPVKLSAGPGSTEEFPVLHKEWYVPPKSSPEAGSVTD